MTKPMYVSWPDVTPKEPSRLNDPGLTVQEFRWAPETEAKLDELYAKMYSEISGVPADVLLGRGRGFRDMMDDPIQSGYAISNLFNAARVRIGGPQYRYLRVSVLGMVLRVRLWRVLSPRERVAREYARWTSQMVAQMRRKW